MLTTLIGKSDDMGVISYLGKGGLQEGGGEGGKRGTEGGGERVKCVCDKVSKCP